MLGAVPLGILTEKCLEMWSRQKLHRHGVNLRGIVRRPNEVDDSFVPAGITLERVSHLVREHVDVVRRAVEIRKDERASEAREPGAEAAARFRRTVLQIE